MHRYEHVAGYRKLKNDLAWSCYTIYRFQMEKLGIMAEPWGSSIKTYTGLIRRSIDSPTITALTTLLFRPEDPELPGMRSRPPRIGTPQPSTSSNNAYTRVVLDICLTWHLAISTRDQASPKMHEKFIRAPGRPGDKFELSRRGNTYLVRISSLKTYQ